ncbi:hypothetical protein [Microbispora rosea]|uniref:hypothetical protein n=1 Tax=Microbispora rosea TaxID=58117 RepID=UPI0034220151
MKKVAITAILVLGWMLAAAPAQAAAPAPAPSSAAAPYGWWPLPGPRCPEQAPAGWQYVRTVQPPFGLAYDLYVFTDQDGSKSYRQVYCV